MKFAERRAQASRDVQATFNVAVQSLKSVEAWDADLDALEQLVGAERRKRVQWRHAARRWQETLDRIQFIARNVKQMGKIHFHKDAVTLDLVLRLRTDGRSRAAIQQQGEAAHALWGEAFPAWKLLDEVTVEELGGLLALALERQQGHSAKHTAWQHASAEMMAKARALDHDCVNWFTEATVRFPAGTVDGDLILARVPTSTRPRQSRAKHKEAANKMVERRAEPLALPSEEHADQAA